MHTDVATMIDLTPDSEEKQKLYRISNGYNPFGIQIDSKAFEIKEILIYSPDGKIIQNRAWFGSDNTYHHFPIPKAVLKRKPVLEGETFIIPLKRERYDSKYSKKCILYIPFGYFNFKVEEHKEFNGFEVHTFPKYSSDKFRDPTGNGISIFDRANTKIAIDEDRKKRIEELNKLLNIHKQEVENVKKELHSMGEYST